MVSSRAYKEAHKHFGLIPGDGLVLHHVDQTLRHTNPKRYNEWRPEDLCVMTREEHNRLHHKGKTFSEEHRKKLSAVRKGRPHSPEHVRKVAEALKISVVQYTLAGEFVKEWSSMTDAKKEGFDRSAIARVCKGKQKTHKGYIWAYKNLDDAKK